MHERSQPIPADRHRPARQVDPVRAAGAPEHLPHGHVRRQRLTDLIEQPYQARVTTIVAGAGYGKTTLALEWAAQSPARVIWLPLGPTDNNQDALAERLYAAAHQAMAPVDLREARTLDGADVKRDALWQALAHLDSDLCLVFDNGQHLTNPACFAMLDEVVARIPASGKLMFLSRNSMPVRLGRLGASGEVREIDASDLRCTQSEAAAMLRRQVLSVIDHEQVDRIWGRAEGWAAGIRLAGLSLQRAAISGVDAPDAAGSAHHFQDEYVAQELLAPLPERVRTFVLETAGLPFLDAGLCDAVLDIANSDALIADVRREWAFAEPDADESGRLRHQLMTGESLRRLAQAASIAGAWERRQRKAVGWLLAEGELELAARMALEDGDVEWAAAAVTPWCQHLADRSALGPLGDFLDQVPEAIVSVRLDLAYWRLMARLGRGNTYGADALFEAIEERMHASGKRLDMGRALLIRGGLAWHGDDEAARRAFADAGDTLPPDALVERLHVASGLARLAFRAGDDATAAVRNAEAEALAYALPIDEQWAWRVIAADRGNAYALRGDVHSAITKYRLMLSELPDVQAEIEVFLRCRLIALLIERNDLAAAAREHVLVEGRIAHGQREWRHDAAIARTRLLLARGERDEAERWGAGYVKELRRRPEKTQLVLSLAAMWLERGEFPLVRSWLGDIDGQRSPWVEVFGDASPHLLAIDLELAQEQFARAATIAQLLVAQAAATHRSAEFIALSMRWAVALFQLGKLDQARKAAGPAIERGARGGFVRSLHVPGFDVTWMFADVWTERPEFSRVRNALQEVIARSPEAPATVLTRREREVLALVAQGWSNQQIADGMYISINTVRNHLVKICRRLGAGSRMEAVIRAREAGILD